MDQAIDSSMTHLPLLEASGISDPGRVRPNNEDSFLLLPHLGLAAVADGMGGAAAGEVASSIFVDSAKRIITAPAPDAAQASELIKRVYIEANHQIMEYAAAHPEAKGLGCTAELLLFHPSGYCLGHVGDSRTYLLRNGTLKRLTKDHTVVQDQLDQGLITPEEARKHPMRNVILRAVGVNEVLAVDIIKGMFIPADTFLLCSDGLSDMIDDTQIHEIMSRRLAPAEMARLLVERANQAGGKDNVTAVIVKVE